MGTFTIKKAMLDAPAAHLQESGLQRTTCAVQSDGLVQLVLSCILQPGGLSWCW